MVKEEPEEKENHSDVGLFIIRHGYLLQNKVLFCAIAKDSLRLRLSAYRVKQKIYLKSS